MAKGADGQPKGEVGEFGYEEFDSKDFEETASDDEEESTDEKPAGDAAAAQGTDKLKPEGDAKPADEESEESDDGELQKADDEEGEGSESKDTDEKAGEEKPAYEPNLKYRVYDQDKDFPDWVKPLIADKASEEQFRDLFSKAEALEPMKKIHQTIVQDRDTQKQRADVLYGNADRIMKLRDQNYRLFFRELGVPDEMLVRAGREIVEARDPDTDPVARQNWQTMRDQEWLAYQQSQQAQNAQLQLQQQGHTAFTQAFDNALSAPHVAAFVAQFDAMKGKPGAFADTVRAHGNFVYGTNGTVLPPHEAVEQMLAFHSKGMPQQQQQQQQQTAGGAGGGKPADQKEVPGKVRERPKGLVTTPRGRNASPLGNARPKSLKEMKKNFARELARGD